MGILKQIDDKHGTFIKYEKHTLDTDGLVVTKIYVEMYFNEGLLKAIGLNYVRTTH